jgi:hypothetical protein
MRQTDFPSSALPQTIETLLHHRSCSVLVLGGRQNFRLGRLGRLGYVRVHAVVSLSLVLSILVMEAEALVLRSHRAVQRRVRAASGRGAA